MCSRALIVESKEQMFEWPLDGVSVQAFFCHFLPNQVVELVLNVENCVAGKKT